MVVFWGSNLLKLEEIVSVLKIILFFLLFKMGFFVVFFLFKIFLELWNWVLFKC